MIRKNTNGDISDEEFEAILKPFIDDYDNFVISYIMPEVIAYYIANSYYRGSVQNINSYKNITKESQKFDSQIQFIYH